MRERRRGEKGVTWSPLLADARPPQEASEAGRSPAPCRSPSTPKVSSLSPASAFRLTQRAACLAGVAVCANRAGAHALVQCGRAALAIGGRSRLSSAAAPTRH